MPTVRFYGKVLPSNAGGQIGVPVLPAFSYEVAPGVRVSHVARVDHSLISVVSEITEFKNEYIAEICKGAIDAVRTAVDMVAFAGGWGWVPQLEFMQLPDGRLVPLVYNLQDMVGVCTAFKLNSTDPKDVEEFGKIYATALVNPALSMAFADLIQAATNFHIAPQNCGRVIDSLRRLLVPKDSSDRSDSWPLLRNAVNADKAYLSFVMDLSKGPRHGDRTVIQGAENLECIKRTWIVMNRFLEFIKRGHQPLPEAEFPELNG